MQVWLKLNHRFRRQSVEVADLYSLNSRVTLNILSRSQKTYQLFPPFQQCIYASLVKIPPLVQSKTQGNPIFDIQSAGVTLKKRSRSPKSNQLSPSSQQCIKASLVKIHQFGQFPSTSSEDNAGKPYFGHSKVPM